MRRITLAVTVAVMVAVAAALWGQSATMILRPPNTILVANEAATGTATNKLVKLTGAPSTGIVTMAGDRDGAVGVCVSGCGVAGASARASIAAWGNVSCVFDGATTAGNYVGISAAVAGDCTDLGASYPAAIQVLGRVLSTNVGAGTYPVALNSTITGSAVPVWVKYALVAIANGVNGCANAAGCWQVNGVLGANKTAGFTQDVVLVALPARAHVTDYRIKVAVRCTGATTALTGLGTTGTNSLYRTLNYNLDQAVAATAIANGPPTAGGSDTHAATNLIASLITTVANVNQLVAGCAVDYWALWGVLP